MCCLCTLTEVATAELDAAHLIGAAFAAKHKAVNRLKQSQMLVDCRIVVQ
jgi:hypothetical protein